MSHILAAPHLGVEHDSQPAAAFVPVASKPRHNNVVSHDDSRQTVEVSICIANWNCRELLRDCLQSLVGPRQGVRLEVIVVDNASTDGAADMVARDFPQVRLIRNRTNRGFAGANNQAAAVAHGEYLFFLNNDTITPPGILAEMIDFLEAHPEVILLGPRLVGPDGRRQTSFRQQPTVGTFAHRTWLCRLSGLLRQRYHAYRGRTEAPEWPCEVELLLGAALLMQRRRFVALGGWDEEFAFGGEDLDLCWRARKVGRIVHYPRVAITHVGRASTKQNIGFASPRIAAGFVRHFRKAGATPWQLFWYKCAVTIDAPLQVLFKTVQFLWRLGRGRRRAAAKSWMDIRGAAAFLMRGLISFWRA